VTASSPRQPNLKCGWLGGGQNGGLNPPAPDQRPALRPARAQVAVLSHSARRKLHRPRHYPAITVPAQIRAAIRDNAYVNIVAKPDLLRPGFGVQRAVWGMNAHLL